MKGIHMTNDSYRVGIGAVIINSKKQILMFARQDNGAWQLPQGGLNPWEDNIEGLFREIKEETGIERTDLTIIAETPDFIPYDIPPNLIPSEYQQKHWKGQAKKWFLLKTSDDVKINLNNENPPEFTDYKWGTKEECLSAIVDFKKDMYITFFSYFTPYLKESKK